MDRGWKMSTQDAAKPLAIASKKHGLKFLYHWAKRMPKIVDIPRSFVIGWWSDRFSKGTQWFCTWTDCFFSFSYLTSPFLFLLIFNAFCQLNSTLVSCKNYSAGITPPSMILSWTHWRVRCGWRRWFGANWFFNCHCFSSWHGDLYVVCGGRLLSKNIHWYTDRKQLLSIPTSYFKDSRAFGRSQ